MWAKLMKISKYFVDVCLYKSKLNCEVFFFTRMIYPIVYNMCVCFLEGSEEQTSEIILFILCVKKS